MRYYCSECNREIPSDLDFCPSCGSLKEKARAVNDSGNVVNTCPQCGSPVNAGDRFCGRCGTEVTHTDHAPVVTPEFRRNTMLAMMLGLIPGFLNIFGLGHLVLKQYSRGLMFLAMSLIIWYVNGWQLFGSSFMMRMVAIMVYFYQGMDLLRYLNSPEVK